MTVDVTGKSVGHFLDVVRKLDGKRTLNTHFSVTVTIYIEILVVYVSPSKLRIWLVSVNIIDINSQRYLKFS